MLLLSCALALMPLAIMGWGLYAAEVVCTAGKRLKAADAEPGGIVLIGLYVFTLAGQIAPYLGPRSFLVGITLLASGLLLICRRSSRVWVSTHWQALLALAIGYLALAVFMATNVHLAGDAELYHLPFIRWTGEEGLVVGLGNVHGRHGFNSSWLSTAALFANSRDWAYGPLVFCVVGTALLFSALTSRSVWALMSGRPACAVFGFVSSLLLLRLIPGLNIFPWITNTDHPAILLVLHGLMVSLGLMEGVAKSAGGGASRTVADNMFDFLVLAVAISLGVTLKVSSLPMSLLVLVAFALMGVRGVLAGFLKPHRKAFLALLVILVVLPAVWSARTFLISGCFLYPVKASCIEVPWFVGWHAVHYEMAWAVSWARITPIHPDDPIFENFRWVPVWASSFDIVRIGVRSALLLLAAAGIATLQLYRGKFRFSRAVLLPLSVTLIGLVLWFFGAPDKRFGGGYIIGALALVLAGVLAMFSPFSRWVAGLATSLWIANFAYLLVFGVDYEGQSLTRRFVIPDPGSVSRTTRSGLVVFETKDRDRCWLLPNPCVPAFNENLRSGYFGPYKMYYMGGK